MLHPAVLEGECDSPLRAELLHKFLVAIAIWLVLVKFSVTAATTVAISC